MLVKGINASRIVFVAMVLLGDFLKLEVIWIIADVVNRLVALPNLVALIALSPIVVLETKKSFAHLKKESSKNIS